MTLDPRTPAGVAHIARLSRLALDPAAAASMAGHMAKILDAVSALEDLDTTGVSPSLHDDDATLALREDEPLPSLTADEALANAPRASHGGFEVPAVLASE